ncbi:ABC transporter substrate-binding protein [Pseudonocardia pini]|uniref:ABC transporter substrate-binding protein n=1 Tax=Pseudonocardia pini TaxID=2758030 RepID=UPI0015F0547F|nr:ABC transporter substrate-binding protein [Pseudonocardia pini]
MPVRAARESRPTASARHRSTTATRLLTAIGTAAALALAGCASDAGTGGSGGSAANPSAAPASDYPIVSYIGGKAGPADPSLPPVVIGYANQQGGPVALPEATFGAEAAVEYVNAELGGIGGHPVKLSSCYIVGQAAEGQRCGQQFVNDPATKAVVLGAVLTGNSALYDTVGGRLPVLGGMSASPADLSAPNTTFLYGSATAGFSSVLAYARSKGMRSVTILMDTSTAGFGGPLIQAAAAATGIEVRPAVYQVGSSDLLGPLAAAGVQSSDALAVFSQTNECVKVQSALRQLSLGDKPILASSNCIDRSVEEAFGDYATWSYSVPINPANVADPEVALYLQKFAEYGGGDTTPGGFAALAFGTMMTTVKMLNSAGGQAATPDAVTAALRSFSGPMYLGPEKMTCGAVAGQPTSCSDVLTVQTYKGGGNWVDEGAFGLPAA